MNAKFVAKTSKDGQIQGLATDSAPVLYFYHPGHLGSTSMVTDADGRITQNVVYIPYGELFVEERNGSWASPYLFNAKELDEETGLYYYGARYLNPSIALWLSTDPLQGKYPGMSPYNYCAGNPVKMVDPDGRDVFLRSEDRASLANVGLLYNHMKKTYESKRFKLKFDHKSGQLHATFTPGRFFWQKRLSSKQRTLLNLCDGPDSHHFRINLIATKTKGQTPPIFDGKAARMFGGAFGGNRLIDGIRETYQYIYVKQLEHLDEITNSEFGKSFHHELTESFEGGKLADERSLQEVKPTTDINSPDYQLYREAHDRATPQPPIEKVIQPDGSVKFQTWDRDPDTNNKRYKDLEDY